MLPENARRRRRQQRVLYLIGAGLLVAIGVVIAAMLLLQRQASNAAQEIQQRGELSVRLQQLQAILVNLADAETGQRGYLLTGDPAYLAPYRSAILQIPELMVDLDGLEDVDPALRGKSAVVMKVVRNKLSELDKTIRLYESGRQTDALVLVQTGTGNRAMAHARQEINEIAETVRSNRNAIGAEIAATGQKRQALAIAAASALSVFVVLAATQIGILLRTRTRFEKELQASEARHRQIVEEQSELISLAGPDGVLTYVNPAYARQFGATPEQLQGQNLFDHVEPAHHGEVRQLIERVFATGTPVRGENRMILSDGREMWVAWTNSLQHGPDGGKQLHSVGRDITDLKRTQTRLRELTEILDNTPDFVVQTDWAGRVHYLNPSARRALGLALDAQEDTHLFTEFNTPETNLRYTQEITPAVKRDGVWLGETTVLAEGARVLPVNHLVIGHRDAQGRTARYSAVMRDISHEVRARAELQLQTSTLHAVIEAVPAMVAVFDKDLRYRLVNREFERQRALRREAVIGRGVAELFGQAEYDARWPWVQRALAGETVTHERLAMHAGIQRHVSVTYIPLHLEHGSVDGFITVAQDITAHREEERRLLDLSERDVLTGLLNRAGFTHYLEHRPTTEESQPLALLYIDLDRFKPVNDTYGHAAGDAVLQQFAQRLKGLVRPTDGVARLGGDEFAVVLPGLREQAAADAIAQKVVDAAGQPFTVNGTTTLHIGASVGVALGDGTPGSIEQLLARADAKVYAAKAAGRGRLA